jgi:general secretion pathway protein E
MYEWDRILLEAGLVRPDQVQAALADVGDPRALPGYLAQNGMVSEGAMYAAMAEASGHQFEAALRGEQLDPQLMQEVPMDFCQRNKVVPIRREGAKVVAATCDPSDYQPLDDLRMLLDAEVTVVIVTPSSMDRVIQEYFEQSRDMTRKVLDDLPDTMEGAVEVSEAAEDLLDVGQKSPVVLLVRSIIFDAIKARASDVHIEPYEKDLKVRYRIDGILYEATHPPKKLQALVISRIKILAGMDIAESRLPQDGRIPITVGDRKLDIRVSTLPTAYGERVVMRILDKSSKVFGLPELGFHADHETSFARLIERPHGILLVTGPTGSGKSTTLYAALSRLRSTETNIITVEDPIENEIAGVGQVQVKPGIGLTFAEGLRSILRQDPDVIMIGEIRDSETAEIAVQASLTGHLVFSTLHTNDAAGGFTRLIEMGVEPYLIASSVVGVLAQRLVREICKECRHAVPTPPALARAYGIRTPEIYEGKGCKACRETGYSGRIGIFELLEVDEQVREKVVSRADSGVIKRLAVEKGMRTLRQDGVLKVEEGKTTIHEVARTTATGAAMVEGEVH